MKSIIFVIASTAILGVIANPYESPVGVEVAYENGRTFVREVVSYSDMEPESFLMTDLALASLAQYEEMH